MYRVYCDGYLLYHENIDGLRIFRPGVELELNKTGSFEFTIYPDHPYYSRLKKLKSEIVIYQGDYRLFRGRVLDEEIGWHNEKLVSCEGDLSFLLDSIQRPLSFSGTVGEFLAYIISLHNSQVDEDKRFTAGVVTVSGDISVDISDYITSFDMLQKQLVEAYGGYLMTRTEDGVNYIDYLAEINLLSPQSITFGKNLVDLKRLRKGGDIASVIIPLGAKVEGAENRLTIAGVNGGADFLQDNDAVTEYGVIVKTVTFDEITDAETLKAAGQAYLSDTVRQWETIELTAADLAALDANITSFHLGTQVSVSSQPHGIAQRFTVSKLSINLLDPAGNKLVLGKTIPALSDAIRGVSDAQGVIMEAVNKTAQTASEAVYNVEQNLQASINVAAENISSKVAEDYYLKDQTDALVSSVSTTIEQTKESVEIQFDKFDADIKAVAEGADAEFEEIHKYIRFEDGKILLGETGNELQLEIANDRISFLQDGAEVAYFSNRKLYVTDADILHSLKLGNFAFMPRANGNLSFKKI